MSGTQQLEPWQRFTYPRSIETEDPFDQGRWREALASLGGHDKEGNPISPPATAQPIYYGTADHRNAGTKITTSFERFTTTAPPDVYEGTRIIALCGVGMERATPRLDGWMISDFFAFWHLFQGLTKNQAWFHMLDLDQLVSTHERYLHGSPYQPRKVVLDKEVLVKMRNSSHPPQRVFSETRNSFLDTVKKECELAHQNSTANTEGPQQTVLIMLFGHGLPEKYSFQIGNRTTRIGVEAVKKRLKPDVPVMLLSTACFSGGWSLENISAMTAAGPLDQSRSWNKSGSSGRHCGGVFASAVIAKLTSFTKDEDGDGIIEVFPGEDSETATQRHESYAEFSRTTYETLLNIDRTGQIHGISFSAQDDNWADHWQSRSGFPIERLKHRWQSLTDWERDQTLHPGDFLNRDPSVTKEQRDEYLEFLVKHRAAVAAGKVGGRVFEDNPTQATGGSFTNTFAKKTLSLLLGGSLESLRSHVSQLSEIYLDSHPGSSSIANNTGVSGAIFQLQNGEHMSAKDLDNLLQELQYRLEVMEKANAYVVYLGIQPPKNCQEFDEDKFQWAKDGVAGNPRWTEVRNLYNSLVLGGDSGSKLFPWPVKGTPFYKVDTYMAAAFFHCNMGPKQCEIRLNALIQKVLDEIDETKELVKTRPVIESKRRKLADSFRFFRSLSPVRRHRKCSPSSKTPPHQSTSGSIKSPVLSPHHQRLSPPSPASSRMQRPQTPRGRQSSSSPSSPRGPQQSGRGQQSGGSPTCGGGGSLVRGRGGNLADRGGRGRGGFGDSSGMAIRDGRG